MNEYLEKFEKYKEHTEVMNTWCSKDDRRIRTMK